MGMTLDAQLSDQEIDELDTFLESEATPHECMSITMHDGFLTALAIAPVSRCRAAGCQLSGVARVTRSSSRLNRRAES
jgi:Uncharacterised protein family (UPF0149)